MAIFDAEGNALSGVNIRLSADDPRALEVELPALADGVYTVGWRALSADDGHVGAGAFALAVGPEAAAPTPADLRLPLGSAFGAPKPTLLAVVGRWLGYAGAASLGGCALVLGFVLWPVFWPAAARGERPGWLPAAAAARLNGLVRAAVLVVGLGALTGLIAQTLEIGSQDPALLRLTLLELLSTRSGPLAAGRVLAALLVAYGLWRLVQAAQPSQRQPPDPLGDPASSVRVKSRTAWRSERQPPGLALALVGASALLMLHALGSHAAASPTWSGVAVVSQWAHLVGLSAWLGGLLVLVVLGPALLDDPAGSEGRAVRAALFGRFARLAMPGVGLLLASGLFQSWLLVGSLDRLLATEYGRTWLAKLILVVPLLALGYLHRRTLPAEQAATRSAPGAAPGVGESLWLTLRLQVALAALVLLATGLLANLPPARDVRSEPALEQYTSPGG